MLRKKIKYDTLKIPEGLTKKIDEMIANSDNDFTSRTDVVKYAIRLLYYRKKKDGEDGN